VPETSEARERVLGVAAMLFRERGYASVTMNDIAAALDVRKASLYYHAPQGKDQLYAEVTRRMLAEVEAGVTAALDAAPPDLKAQLSALAGFYLSQPPMDAARLFRSDLHALPPEIAGELLEVANRAFFAPIHALLMAAVERGEIKPVEEPHMIAVTFVTSLESLHELSGYKQKSKDKLGAALVDLYMDGLRR